MKQVFILIFFFTICVAGLAQKNNPTYLYEGENMEEKIKKYLFCKVEVSKKTVYINEPIEVTFKLYSALESNSYIKGFPNFDGFSTHDMGEHDAISKVVINDITYNCHTLKKLQIFPNDAGSYEITPVQITNRVVFKKISELINENDGLPHYKNTNGEIITNIETSYEMATEPVVINVNPLPVIDSSYTGAVGNFSIETNVKAKEISLNEVIEISYNIYGSGNLHMINTIKPNFPNTVENLSPIDAQQIDYTVLPSKGKKTFSYSLVPKDTGIIKIPSFTIAYFNPEASRFYKMQSDSIIIHVTAAKIKKVTSSNMHAEGLWTRYKTWLILIGICLIGSVIVIWYKVKKTNKKPPVILEKEELMEEKQIADYFPRTKTLIALNEHKEGLISLRKELLKAVAEKNKLPLHMSYMQLLQQINSTDANSLRLIVNEIDKNLYAGNDGSVSLNDLFSKAKKIVEELS